MMSETRYRKCSCGAQMQITLETDDEQKKATRVVWENVYPVGDATRGPQWIFNKGLLYRVRCQLCHAVRGVTTFTP